MSTRIFDDQRNAKMFLDLCEQPTILCKTAYFGYSELKVNDKDICNNNEGTNSYLIKYTSFLCVFLCMPKLQLIKRNTLVQMAHAWLLVRLVFVQLLGKYA